MSPLNAKAILYFEIGAIWYFVRQDNEIKRSKFEDIRNLINDNIIHRAILHKNETKIINNFVIQLVFHSPTIETDDVY